MNFMLFTVTISLKLCAISIVWVTCNKKRTCLSDGNKKGVEVRYQAN